VRRLLVLLLLVGCDAKPATPPSPAGHVHQAPHGGALVELGQEFAHVELVFESATGKVTAYVLDGEVEKPFRLEQKELLLKGKTQSLALQAVGSPLTGEKPGDTSQFEGRSDGLKGATEFDAALVRIVVKGREFHDVPLRLQPLRKQD
jgi:hypothetical protein